MSDAMLTFVSPYFQFCLHVEAVMVARFSFLKKRKNGFSKIVTYYSLALFLVIEGSCMQSNQFWFDLKLGR